MAAEAIILFFRLPEAGRVKTRLAVDLGAPATLSLYRALLDDCRDAARGTGRPLVAAWSGGDAAARPRWMDECPCLEQRGRDLGERMHDALVRAAALGYDRLVLAGCDCPGLDGARFDAAFAALEQGDAVLGPSRDGGYYLVGLRAGAIAPALFADIAWSTDRVFERSRAAMRARGLSLALIDEDEDVDTIDDLRRLAGSARGGPRTRAALAALDLGGAR